MTSVLPLDERIRRELDRLVPCSVHADRRAGLLVACSGGPDSTALLRIAAAWASDVGAPLEAAHYHHGLRGADADADEAFCRDLCATLDLRLHVGRRPTSAAEPVTAAGPALDEDTARRLRRTYLESVLDGFAGPAVCATGHHRDDQAETVIMRLFRGAGADGLRGIRPASGRFVHPLLPCGRHEIVAWLEAAGHRWRDDASNLDGVNLRARMRRRLTPVLRDLFGPAAVAGPVRAARLLEADAEALNGIAADLIAAWRAGDLGESLDDDALPVAGLREQPFAVGVRLVRAVISGHADEPSPLEERHLRDLLDWAASARSGSCLDLPAGLTAILEFDRIRFEAVPAGAARGFAALDVRPAEVDEMQARTAEAGLDPPAGRWRLTCPAEIVRGAPRLRPWSAGDRLTPFGMDGRKKVSDLLREHRVPVARRAEVRIVEDDDGPLWVVGLCREERTRLLPSTERGLTLLVERREPEAADSGA